MLKSYIKNSILFFLLSIGIVFSQEKNSEGIIPRDTSYTLYSAAKKMYKKFPEARLVTDILPSSVKVKKDIIYKRIGNRKLSLNVYYPAIKGEKYFPGILMIYGGGWRSGDISLSIPMAERLAAKGFVTVTAEYRLSKEALYPAAVIDLKTAVRWMRANALKFHIDTDKIAAYGCSAGGELAAFLGTTGNLKKFDKGEYLNYSSCVEAIVNVDGNLDFTDTNYTAPDSNPLKPTYAQLWLGSSFKENPKLWKDASPITYVTKNSPPQIFINSAVPRFHAGRDSMIKLLNKYHIYSEVHTLPGTIHTFWLFQPWFEKTFSYTIEFLDKIFHKK